MAKQRKTNEVEDNIKKSASNQTSNRRSRRRKPNSKSKECKPSDSKALVPLSDDVNDSSYYYDDPTIREQVTNYSFNQFAGVNFHIGQGLNSDNEAFFFEGNIPTLMRIETMISAGASNNPQYSGDVYSLEVTDGVTRAGLKNYYRLSAGNAKTTNYQPQDVTMLIFALCSIMEQISYVQRIFGCVYIFNVRNRDLPKRLIEMMGVNYDDFTSKLANYRIRFNVVLNLLNKVPIPSNIKAFMKCSAMYQNLYTDDTSPMAQIMAMVPAGYWTFDEGNAKLAWTRQTYNTLTDMGSILFRLESQINAVLTSATFNFIYADILRLAEKGEMNLLQYGTIPENYIAPILYSNEFNLWVNNLTIAPEPGTAIDTFSTNSNDVFQNIDKNTLNYCPATVGMGLGTVQMENYILNFDENNPDVESRIAATRLVTGLHGGLTQSNLIYKHYIAGTHIVTKVYIIGKHANNSNNVIELSTNLRTVIQDSGYLADTLAKITSLNKFKHAPRFYVAVPGTDTLYPDSYISGDLDYYTTVDNDYLRRLFDTEWIAYLTIG